MKFVDTTGRVEKFQKKYKWVGYGKKAEAGRAATNRTTAETAVVAGISEPARAHRRCRGWRLFGLRLLARAPDT